MLCIFSSLFFLLLLTYYYPPLILHRFSSLSLSPRPFPRAFVVIVLLLRRFLLLLLFGMNGGSGFRIQWSTTTMHAGWAFFWRHAHTHFSRNSELSIIQIRPTKRGRMMEGRREPFDVDDSIIFNSSVALHACMHACNCSVSNLI
jgi:hypothetical protein